MGISISKLGKADKPLPVEFGDGQILQCVYSPSMYTPALEQEMHKAITDNLPGKMLYTMVLKVIRRWDLTDDDGKPWPLTVEGMMEIPIPVLSTIVGAIGKDQRPEEQKSADSEGSF